MKGAWAYALVAAVIAGAWLALRPPEMPEPVAAVPSDLDRPGTAAPATPPSLTASAVLSIDPTHASAGTSGKARPASLYGEYLAARQYRAIYERLRDAPEGQGAEGKLVLYEILRACATITEGRRPGFRPTLPKRDDFLAGLPEGDPLRERRVEAFDLYAEDHCKGFENVSLTQAELGKLLSDAAAMGDARARALAMEQELWAQRRAGGGDFRAARDGGVTLTDAQVAQLQQIASTKDPDAIRVAGRVLANAWSDYSVRLGNDPQPVEQRPFMNAWLVLACEYGANCGADTPRMLQACAFQGHCNAQTFPDYLYYYASTPHDSQLLVQYRAVLRNALDTGDWSQFAVVRGSTPPNRITFVPGPR